MTTTSSYLRHVELFSDEVPSARLLPNSTTSDRRKRDLRAAYRKRIADGLRASLKRRREALGQPFDGTVLCAAYAASVVDYDLDITVYWPAGRRRPDTDGALSSLKGLLDGAADVLGVDDRKLDELTIRQRRAAVGSDGCVELRYAIRATDLSHAYCYGACERSALLDIA